jgi:hypothetical protein
VVDNSSQTENEALCFTLMAEPAPACSALGVNGTATTVARYFRLSNN